MLNRCLLLLLLALLLHATTNAAETPSRILVLHSYHHGFPWTDSVDRGLRTGLKREQEQLQIFTEYLDTKLFPPGEQFPRLQRLLAEKYRRKHFAAIITSDDNALDFALHYRKKLFPGTPIIFCGVNDLKSHQLERHALVSGVPERFDIAGTVRLALKLFPDTRTIALVNDSTPTGRSNLRSFLAFRSQLPKDIDIHLLSELTQDELRQGLRNLPKNSIVLNLGFWRDRHGNILNNRQSLQLLAGNCSRPVFTLWDFLVGQGTLGGLVVNGEEQGRHAARLVLRILDGANPASLKIESRSPNTPMFDYPAMARFGLSPRQLPAGTVLLNQPDSWLLRYQHFILPGIGLLIFETLLLTLLIFNISRRRLSERRLAAREADFRKLIEASPLPIRVTRLGGDINYLNREFTRTFGYDLQDIPTMEAWFQRAHPDPAYRREIEQFWTEQVEDDTRFGRPIDLREWRVRCKDGREKEISFGHTQLSDFGVTVMFDVSSRNRAMRERQAMEQKLQQSQKLESLGVLAGGIAHDFNNLLMGILGCADLALMKLPEESPVREPMKMIVKSAERASDLTAQMLAYSGKGRFVVERIDLNLLVEEMTHLLQTVISKSAVLKLNLAAQPITAEVDATQLRQVIMNLITNASDAIGERSGVIAITTGVMEASAEYLAGSFLDDNLEPGPFAFIEVSDTGIGMDEETCQRIFDPFFTTKFAGRGLGLAAVLGIVRSHRGAIRIYSEPGKGTSFKILLPCSAAQTVDTGQTSGLQIPGNLAERCGAILIVDDDETVRSVGRMMLEEHGFTVHLAEDGRQGVEAFAKASEHIGLVLLDLTMPHLGGEEAFRQMREIRPDVRVILSSGYNEQDATDLFAGKGLAGFLHKPYRSEDLLVKVIETLQA